MIDSPMSSAEAWLLTYLLNSLWQVPLVFAAAWLAARLLRPLGPTREHCVWVAALLLEAILPAFSVQAWGTLRALLVFALSTGSTQGGKVSVVMGPGNGLVSLHLSATLPIFIATTYALIILYFFVRLVWRIAQTHTLRRDSVPTILSPDICRFWAVCAQRLHVPDAALALSSCILGPLTLGVRKRLVLLPTTMVDLAAEDLHVVIAHEFAHMRRRDFAKNLAYEILTLLVSYHPIHWLLREQLIETREEICDQLAADLVAGRQRYARSLLRLAALLVEGRAIPSTHAIGIFDANAFERRIMKLTANPQTTGIFTRIALLAASVVLALGTCVSALALRTDVTLPLAPEASGAAAFDGPHKINGGIMAGQILSKTQPVYPTEAKAAKVQGSVVLHAIIGTDGQVQNLTVISGPELLCASALQAVSKWIYKPYLLNGEPTEVDTTITVNYTLVDN
jgi:TonB family protein